MSYLAEFQDPPAPRKSSPRVLTKPTEPPPIRGESRDGHRKATDRTDGTDGTAAGNLADPYSVRWGPGLSDSTPPIHVPFSWRHVAAAWPPDRWRRWRATSAGLLAGLGYGPTARQIVTADWMAYRIELAEHPVPGDAPADDTPPGVPGYAGPDPDPHAGAERAALQSGPFMIGKNA